MNHLIIVLIALMAWNCHSADVDNQEALNELCRSNSLATFARMNANVAFGICQTESTRWQETSVGEYKFLVKQRGVPMSVALHDLLEATSNTRFECNTAQIVNVFSNLLLVLDVDNIVAKIESDHDDFQFPLIQLAVIGVLADQPGNTTEDSRRLKKLRDDRIKVDMLYSVLAQANLTCDGRQRTPPGGLLFLPNISGIQTRSRGENLVFVDEEKQLYYGFNPAFKDGPKTLMETGDRLEESLKPISSLCICFGK